ncbi:MAG: 2-nitropropane dioxygenase, partial [Alphaproteobacteria bacterium]|nr:2-nitropropane dioxygenase [Alphaproteobacteria bacterium]
EVVAQYRAGALDQKAAQLAIEHFWAGALRRAVIEGDIERGSLMAGQSVGMVDGEQTVAEILEDLTIQAAATLVRLCQPLA